LFLEIMAWMDMSTVSTVAWFLGIGLTSVVVAAYYFQDGLLYVPSLPGLPRDVMVTPFAFGWKSDLAEYEQVWVREPTDNLKLQAWFFRCHKDARIARSRPTVLFLHSNAGNLSHRIPNIRDLVEICRFNVFILSYRGYGRSEGTPSEEGLKRDAAAALRHLATVDRPEVDPTKIIVLGRSLGGAVGIWLAANFPEWTKGLMVENAFTSVPDMVDVVLPALKYVKWLSRNTWNNLREIDRVTVPIIFLSSARDELVPPAHMHALHNAARHAPLARFVSFPHAQHMNCVPEADHQILTNAGFLALADVEARVERDAAGRVVDWRGLQVASYDAAAEQLVYRTPRALVVNSGGAQALVELSDRDERARWNGASPRLASKPTTTAAATGRHTHQRCDDAWSRVVCARAVVELVCETNCCHCSTWRRCNSALSLCCAQRCRRGQERRAQFDGQAAHRRLWSLCRAARVVWLLARRWRIGVEQAGVVWRRRRVVCQ
jgi:pimeloyl-ACP methyl ester carboxylesterase